MRKISMMCVVLLLAAVLAGCGKSEAVKNVEGMIEQLGEVTVESMAAIDTAIAAYDALTEEEKAKVENYATLTSARDNCLELQIHGEWAYELTFFYDVPNMYDKVDLTLNADGTAFGAGFPGDMNWSVSNMLLVLSDGTLEYQMKLVPGENGYVIEDAMGGKMNRVADNNAILDEMFTIVELDEENILDYAEIAIVTDEEIDGFGDYTGNTTVYSTLKSTVFDDGLMCFNVSDDIVVEMHIPAHKVKWTDGRFKSTYTYEEETVQMQYVLYGQFGGYLGGIWEGSEDVHEITVDQMSLGRVKGTVVFIDSQYVDEVVEEDQSRVLVVKGEKYYVGPWIDEFEY